MQFLLPLCFAVFRVCYLPFFSLAPHSRFHPMQEWGLAAIAITQSVERISHSSKASTSTDDPTGTTHISALIAVTCSDTSIAYNMPIPVFILIYTFTIQTQKQQPQANKRIEWGTFKVNVLLPCSTTSALNAVGRHKMLHESDTDACIASTRVTSVTGHSECFLLLSKFRWPKKNIVNSLTAYKKN